MSGPPKRRGIRAIIRDGLSRAGEFISYEFHPGAFDAPGMFLAACGGLIGVTAAVISAPTGLAALGMIIGGVIGLPMLGGLIAATLAGFSGLILGLGEGLAKYGALDDNTPAPSFLKQLDKLPPNTKLLTRLQAKASMSFASSAGAPSADALQSPKNPAPASTPAAKRPH